MVAWQPVLPDIVWAPYARFPDLATRLPLLFNICSGTWCPWPGAGLVSPDRGQACGLLSAAHLPSHSHRNLRPHFLTKGTGQSSKHLLAYVPPSIATPGTFLWGTQMTHGLYAPPGKDSGSIAYGGHLQLSEAPGVAPGPTSQPSSGGQHPTADQCGRQRPGVSA